MQFSTYAKLAGNHLVLVFCSLFLLPFNQLKAQTYQHTSTFYASSVIHAEDVTSPSSSANACVAEDATLWAALDPNQPGNSVSHLKIKEIRSHVKFFIDHTDPKVYTPYTYRVHFKAKGYSQPGNIAAYTEFYDTLTVSYNPDSTNAYQDVHMKTYYGFYRLEVEIQEVYDYTCLYVMPGSSGPPPCSTPPSQGFIATNTLSQMQANWDLEVEIDGQRFDKDLHDGSSWVNAIGPNIELTVDHTPPQNNDNHLTINWQLVSGQMPVPAMYELEWVYVDDYKVTFTSDPLHFNYPVLSKIPLQECHYNFNNGATRIITDKASYTIPLIYRSGYLIYRARILRPDQNNYRTTIQGAWSISADNALVSTLTNGSQYYAISGDAIHLNDKYNWNLETSYAEEGKSKAVVSYYDGLLKSRQTVTKLASFPDQQIVQEKYYNYEGKVGLQTLPVPIAQNALKFTGNFAVSSGSSQPYRPADYDPLNVALLPPATSGSLVSNYFSSVNSFYLSLGQQYKYLKSVPDAEGFPLIHTRLDPVDGRVVAQGGAGPALQIGTGHEMRNYYMAPEPLELNRYFGLHSEKSVFYEKTITKDPNNQLSFTIANNRGKTVMSGMMGYPPAPGTSPLLLPDGVTVPTATPANFPKSDLLDGSTAIWSGSVRTFNKPFFQEVSGTSNFSHKLTVPDFSPCQGSYLQIPFAYSIRLIDEYGASQTLNANTIGGIYAGSTAPVPTTITNPLLPASLSSGKQIINYEVSYKPVDISAAVNSALYPVIPQPIPPGWVSPYPTCLRKKADFLRDAYDAVNLDCNDNSVGELSQCAEYERLLMSELFPMQKYGRYKIDGNGVLVGQNGGLFAMVGDGPITSSSSFTPPTGAWEQYSVIGATNAPSKVYRYQAYLYTLSPTTPVPGTSHTAGTLLQMDPKQFIAAFNDDIARFLLPLHPELCKKNKIYCDNTNFEQQLAAIPSYSVAVNLNLAKLNDIIAADPLFTVTGMAMSKLSNVQVFDQTNVGPNSPPTSQDNLIDRFVYIKLHCGLTFDPANCRQDYLSTASISNTAFQAEINSMPTVDQDRYYMELIQTYIANRQTRIARYPVEEGQNISCTQPAMVMQNHPEYAPPVLQLMFSAVNDELYQPHPNPAPGQGTQAGDGVTNSNQALWDLFHTNVAAGVSTINTSINQQIGLEEYADRIIQNLANCVNAANPQIFANLQNLRTAILSYAAAPTTEAPEWKGHITPDALKSLMQNQGIRLDDLCNPYLINYLPSNMMTRCRDTAFFNQINAIIYPFASKFTPYLGTSPTTTGYSVGTVTYYGSTGLIDRLGKKLNGPSAGSTFTVDYQMYYDPNIQAFTIILTGSITGASVQIHLRCLDPQFRMLVGVYTACDPLHPTAGDMITFNANSLAPHPQHYSDHFSGYIKGLYPEEPQNGTCLSCVELKKAYADYLVKVVNSTTGYEIKGKGHPFYETSLQSFFNYYFKKSHSAEKYLQFMESCDLAGMYRMSAYYGYLHATSTGSIPATDLISSYFAGQPDYRNYRHLYYYYTDNSNVTQSHFLVDFTSLPKAKLRQIIYALQNYVNTSATASSLTPPAMHFNMLEPEISSSNAVFADLFVNHNDGAATYYPTVASPNPGPPNLNWYPDLNIVNPSTPANLSLSQQLVNVKHNGFTFKYNRFRFELNDPAATPKELSADVYNFLAMLPDQSRSFQHFENFVTHVNSDNLNTSKRDYLKYVYDKEAYFVSNGKTALMEQLAAQALTAATGINGAPNYTNNYGSFPYVSYYNPDKEGLSGDLVIKPFAGGENGLSAASAVIMKTNQLSGTCFPVNMVVAQPYQYGTSPVGNEMLTVRYIGNNTFWYHLEHQVSHAHRNIWVKLPAFIVPSEFSLYALQTISMVPNSENSRRLKLVINKPPNGPAIEVFGKTDFDLTTTPLTVFENVMLCDDYGDVQDTIATCYERQMQVAASDAESRFAAYLDSVKVSYVNLFQHHIRTTITDELELQTPQSKYIVTLYGYDRAGNLIYTVPPEGVATVADNKLGSVNLYRKFPGLFFTPSSIQGITPQHTKVTNYYYNSQNQVIIQSSPDAGTTDFMYDRGGRLRLSQNAQQKLDKKYSYTLYDEQNRIVESGQVLSNAAIIAHATNLQNQNAASSPQAIDAAILASPRSDVTHTYYDEEMADLSLQTGMGRQEFLRARVATMASFTNLAAGQAPQFSTYSVAIHYSYDISGNVKTLTYDMPQLADVKQRYKRIDYDYDLYSGKVTLVSYNRSFADQFYQRYTYDDDNRLTETQTSKDGLLWDRDAAYTYYPHGPLARVSLGDLRVQGIDYAYTLQGWLKTINGDAPDPTHDLGSDGAGNTAYQQDLLRGSLSYYKGDYKPIDPTDNTSTSGTTMSRIPDLDAPGATNPQSLYNGNIAAATIIPGYFPGLYTNYQYDQLNRIKGATYQLPDYSPTSGPAVLRNFSDNLYGGLAFEGATNPDDLYRSAYSYDRDGNITAMTRYGLRSAAGVSNYTGGSTFLMDNLQYQYDPLQQNNRLVNFTDGANHNTANTGFSNDLKYYSVANPAVNNRFLYDANGNITKDLSNDLSAITWNGMGKVSSVAMSGGKMLSMLYEPGGNRLSKSMKSTEARTYEKEFYIREASGNILAVYRQLQKYTLEKPFLGTLGGIIGKTTFGTELGTALGGSGSFPSALIRRLGDSYGSFLDGHLATKPPGFYLSAGARQALFTVVSSDGTDLLAALGTAYPALAASVVSDSFRPDFFRPLFTDTVAGQRRRFLGLLTAPGDTATMNAILAAMGSTVLVEDTAAFAGYLDALLTEDAVVAPLGSALAAVLGGDSSLRAATVARLLGDADYRSSPQPDWTYNSVNAYLLDRIMAEGDSATLAAYFDNMSGGDKWLEGAMSREGRASLVYNDNPAAFLDAMKAGLGDQATMEVIDEALSEAGEFNPASFALRLTVVGDNPVVASTSFAEVMAYNKFFLAEHHIYGSSRLGIKTYWPNQYLYQWDAGKTIAQNAEALSYSEFSYRRPWYSGVYNSLITASSLTPWGAASTMGMYSERVLGQKRYELTNHLGNVMSVITDKVTEVRKNALEPYPAVADKRASLAAAYDYYPFGMLMPERYVEDASVQCTPVTHTRYVGVTVPVYEQSYNSPTSIASVGLKAGTGVSWDEVNRRPMAILFPDGGDDIEGYVEVGSPQAGQRVSVLAALESLGSDVVWVSLEQADGNGDWQRLVEVPVRYYEEVKLETEVPYASTLRVAMRTTGQNKIGVSGIRYITYDQVQQSYVTLSCNSEDGARPDYRFGFNGMHKDSEVKGTGNSLDFGARVYDSRLGKFLSIDPMTGIFPSISPYSFAENSPIAMIDKNGRHGEIVIEKTGSAKGAAIKKVTVNVVLLLPKEQENKQTVMYGDVVRDSRYEISETWGRKTYLGEVSGQHYEATYNIKIKDGITTTEASLMSVANPTYNRMYINNGPTQAGGGYLNFNTKQRVSYDYPVAHEISHILGEEGDRDMGNAYMSNYSGDRQVQDQEVNDFLAPAIRLANEFEGQKVIVHFFSNQNADGKIDALHNTYKVYNPVSGKYLKSETVPIINPQKK